MADEITAKHLAKLRIRGAPATVPGGGPMVGEYPPQQVMRSAVRVLAKPLEQPLTFEALKTALGELREAQKRQGLGVAGNAILAVLDDPMEIVPHKRKLELMLPIRGPSKEEGDIKPARIDGGFYVSSRVVGSLASLEDAYTYLLGKFLPSRRWELARKQILNILPEDLDTANEKQLVMEVAIPGTMKHDAQQEPEPNPPVG
jgi:DNA gyrase inhibitor GyrI